MSRVFMVQRPVYRNPDPHGPQWLDKYDLTPALKFGRLVEVVPAGRVPRDVGATVRLVEQAVSDFAVGDHLLATGDPVSIAIAVMACSRRTGGPVSILKYDRHTGTYSANLVDPGA